MYYNTSFVHSAPSKTSTSSMRFWISGGPGPVNRIDQKRSASRQRHVRRTSYMTISPWNTWTRPSTSTSPLSSRYPRPPFKSNLRTQSLHSMCKSYASVVWYLRMLALTLLPLFSDERSVGGTAQYLPHIHKVNPSRKFHFSVEVGVHVYYGPYAAHSNGSSGCNSLAPRPGYRIGVRE